MSDRCAPQHTSKTFTAAGAAGALTVAGGGFIHVYGIWFHTGNEVVTFNINDASGNLIQQVYLGVNSFEELTVYWVADAGIQITASAVAQSPKVTVFHNAPGR